MRGCAYQTNKNLEAKSRLNRLDHYKHICVYQDKIRWQRQYEVYVRLLVRSLGLHKLCVRGYRVCKKDNQQTTSKHEPCARSKSG